MKAESISFSNQPFLPQAVAKLASSRHEEKGARPTARMESNPNLQQFAARITFRGFNRSIGVSEYELTRALPDDLKSSLPTVEEIETELAGEGME